MKKSFKACSLFSSAGIGEYFLAELGINVIVANELLNDRAELYKHLYPETKMVTGDIRNKEVFNELVSSCKGIDILIATPPCQGFSVAGKNRDDKNFSSDERNNLIFEVVKFIKSTNPNYILIENVTRFLKMKVDNDLEIVEFLKAELPDYLVKSNIYNTEDFGVPQSRKRAIIRIFKKELTWNDPKPTFKKSTVEETIGHLPSLESGESSEISWHWARKHIGRQVKCMENTATGKSAFENKIHYPKNREGRKLKGYNTTYRRIDWHKPAPTITIRNDAISSQMNVHPGRALSNGKYSDARVLTPKELFLLSSLPDEFDPDRRFNELLIRQCIGESVPPLFLAEIMKELQ